MKRSKKHINSVWLWMLLAIGVLLMAGPAGAFSGITVDPDRIQFVDLVAQVMEVNVAKGYIVVAEETFLITEFKIAGKIYQSAALNAEGRSIPFTALKKGQRVMVKGIKLEKDNIAGLVQRIPPGKKVTRDFQFMDKAGSIRPAR